jgi:LysM repeat protein
MTALSYFTVVQSMRDVETSTTPHVDPFINFVSCSTTFTPNHSEIYSLALDETVLLDPITGRVNTSMNSGTYVVVSGDTWASIAAKIGGAGITVATLQAANPTVSTLTPGITINTPSGADGVLRDLDGTLGVQLVDNANLGLASGVLTYQVDYSNAVWDSLSDRHISSKLITAPGDGSTIDLNNPADFTLLT